MLSIEDESHSLLSSALQDHAHVVLSCDSASTSAGEWDEEEQQQKHQQQYKTLLERKSVRLKTVICSFKVFLHMCYCFSRWFRCYRAHQQMKQRGMRRMARVLVCSMIFPILIVMLIYLELYTSMNYRSAPHHEWSYNKSRHLADYVLPEVNTTLLEPYLVCDDKIFLLIMVCSAAQNFAERQTIRETWGNTSYFNYGLFSRMHSHVKENFLWPSQERISFYGEYLHMAENQTTVPEKLPVRVLFLLGHEGLNKGNVDKNDKLLVHEEQTTYNDLVVEDFVDSYSNLTIKTVLGLKWAARTCLHSSAFLMKCDDDSFVNVPNLLHFLLGGIIPIYNDTHYIYDETTARTWDRKNALFQTRNYLTGFAFCGARPVADVRSKWYMPHYMFPLDVYPKYLSGSAYLMSMDVVQKLYKAALLTPLVYLEDLYITGMVAAKAHVKRNHQPLFGYLKSNTYCTFKGTLTQHYISNGDMRDAYNFLINKNNRCSPPWKHILELMRRRKHRNC